MKKYIFGIIFSLILTLQGQSQWFINDRQLSISVDGDTTIVKAPSPSTLLKLLMGNESIIFDDGNDKISINSTAIDLNGSVTEEGEVLCYGGMAFTDSTQVINLSQNVWYKIRNSYDSLFTIMPNCDMVIAGDSIQLPAGTYRIRYDFRVVATKDNVYDFAVFANNLEITTFGHSPCDFPVSVKCYYVGTEFIYTFASTTWLSWRVINKTNGDDITFKNGSIVIERKE